MEKKVLLTILSQQQFQQDRPEKTKLVTEGTMSEEDGKVILSYWESAITGLEGTKTSFVVENDKVTLIRSGTVASKMTFVVGKEDRSLYDMGFGALLIAVRTEYIKASFHKHGGSLRVSYGISIEDETAGSIRYLIRAQVIEKAGNDDVFSQKDRAEAE